MLVLLTLTISKLLTYFQSQNDDSPHADNLSVENNVRVEDELLPEDELFFEVNLPLKDDLPLEDNSPFAYNPPSKNVVTWFIPNFTERYESAVDGDEWASGEYTVEHPTRGHVRFLFVVLPKYAELGNNFYILISPLKENAIDIVTKMECEVWLETMDGQTSEIKSGVIKILQPRDTTLFEFTEDELKRFVGHNTIRLSCRFPFEATQLSSLSSTHTVHRWTIAYFAEWFQHITQGNGFESSTFSVQGLPDVSCNLWFHPKGSTNPGHCGIYLHVSHFGNRQKLPLQFDLWLENRNGSRIRKKAFLYTFTKVDNRRGFSSYSTHQELLELVSNGPLYICCTIRPLMSKKEMTESMTFPPHQEQTFNAVEFSDAEVRVEDRIFKVNKSILSAHSPVFGRMFSGDTKENKTSVVEITDLKANEVELMLRFMYSGRVEKLYQWAYDLLPLADRYDVELLTEVCIESIGNNLKVTNAVECLELVATYPHLDKLKARVFVFVRKNYEEIIKLPKWKSFVWSNPELLAELFVYVRSVYS